jgi:hypothetical protein
MVWNTQIAIRLDEPLERRVRIDRLCSGSGKRPHLLRHASRRTSANADISYMFYQLYSVVKQPLTHRVNLTLFRGLMKRDFVQTGTSHCNHVEGFTQRNIWGFKEMYVVTTTENAVKQQVCQPPRLSPTIWRDWATALLNIQVLYKDTCRLLNIDRCCKATKYL